MRRVLTFLLAASVALTVGFADPLGADVPGQVSTADVELSRYTGTWYEQSSTPAFFSVGCTCTTARYDAVSPTEIALRNDCNKPRPKGRLVSIEGRGVVPDPAETGQLLIGFGNAEPSAEYWIVATDDDPDDPDGAYRFAAVSDSQQAYLFILLRTPRVERGDRSALQAFLADLDARGFRVADLQRTPQPGTCEYDLSPAG